MAVTLTVAFSAGMAYWCYGMFAGDGDAANHYFQPRGIPMSHQWMYTSGLLAFALFLALHTRSYWRKRETGDIK